jgi:hypothetical protein
MTARGDEPLRAKVEEYEIEGVLARSKRLLLFCAAVLLAVELAALVIEMAG